MRMVAYAAHTYGAHNDEDYPDIFFLNHGIKGVDNTAKLDTTFRDGIVEGVYRLEEWGASLIGIACNTAHSYLNDLQVRDTTVMVDLIEEVALRAQRNHVLYGLLTSRGTLDSRLYIDKLLAYDVEFLAANESQQDDLDSAISYVMAHRSDEAARILKKVLIDFKHKGVTHFIIGCTELPLAIDQMDKDDILVISSNQVLAEKLVDLYYRYKHNSIVLK